MTDIMPAPDERREHTTARTLVFTSAQSNTGLNEPFFHALLAYCAARNAELHISRFTYNKAGFGSNSIKPGTEQAFDTDDAWWDTRIADYVSDNSLQLTPDLVWCGELNILPTASNPLGKFRTYTRQASAIIPHAKMAMESVPTMKHEPVKFLYTTGTITQRNYIQKSAGQIAEFHHVFGALVVEIAPDGTWWARQLNADKTGGFYDLGTYWTADGPQRNLPVAAITHGDLHGDKIDMAVVEAVWGAGKIVDQLRPEQQHFHDTVDFTARNHHNIGDPHHLHDRWVNERGGVEREFRETAALFDHTFSRVFSLNVVVVSNHDQAIERWLRDTRAVYDPENAALWYQLNLYAHRLREEGLTPHPFSHLLKKHLSDFARKRTVFVHEDQRWPLLNEIECGVHGHLGPNGARGTPKNLRVIGKANTAHTHSAGIVEGVYTAGVYGNIDMGYNKGLSSWSHSMIVTYPNAKRAILTIKNGRAWR